jgi:UDP-2,4-diacetamido-2,4,6-trideoxy-beta-L-altropyranose hydrolase
MKKILFRANSSSTIGTGHIMRDVVLAKKYAKKGHTVIFATQNLDGNINDKILDEGFSLEILKSNSKKELKELIKRLHIDFIVFDSYKIDDKFEKYIKEKTGVKILSFDDTYQKHYCDILLNHNISADKKKYKKLVPQNCKVKCGVKYTLLRDEFYKEKNKRYKPNKKFTFFVAMGGADTTNLNIKLLKILKKFDNIKVNIVTTTANKNLQELKKYCKNKKWITLHVNSKKIAKLIKKSDYAIITPSVVANELYFMNKSFMAIKVVNNQMRMYSFLKNNGYSVLKKFDEFKIYINVKKYLND